MPAPSPVPQASVTSVAEAMARMQAIDTATPAGDGLACFNRMYLEVTRGWTANSAGEALLIPCS